MAAEIWALCVSFLSTEQGGKKFLHSGIRLYPTVLEGTHRVVKKVFDSGKSTSSLRDVRAMSPKLWRGSETFGPTCVRGLRLNRAEEAVIKPFWNWVSPHANFLLGRKILIHAENYPKEKKTGNREILFMHTGALAWGQPSTLFQPQTSPESQAASCVKLLVDTVTWTSALGEFKMGLTNSL